MSSYADLTWNDPNPVKRLLQHLRLRDALRFAVPLPMGAQVLDFGAGDGALMAHLARLRPDLHLTLYEPTAFLFDEAVRHLGPDTKVRCLPMREALRSAAPRFGYDLILATEVFEHLPLAQTDEALDDLEALVRPDGRIVFGVPVETGLPAFLKGLFRAVRRPSDFDGHIGRILAASIGLPPKQRPVHLLGPGLAYHSHHLGFDHRKFQRRVAESLVIEAVRASPFRLGGAHLNPEIYVVARRRLTDPAADPDLT